MSDLQFGKGDLHVDVTRAVNIVKVDTFRDAVLVNTHPVMA